MAYFKYRRFALIDENGGYFVSRLKQNANPVITKELREWRGSDPANLWVISVAELRGETYSRLNTVDRVPNSSVNYYDAIRLEGKQIQDVVDDLYRTYIDVEVEAEFKQELYNDTQSLDTKRLRFVDVR